MGAEEEREDHELHLYRAPEFALEAMDAASPAADVYAFGVLMTALHAWVYPRADDPLHAASASQRLESAREALSSSIPARRNQMEARVESGVRAFDPDAAGAASNCDDRSMNTAQGLFAALAVDCMASGPHIRPSAERVHRRMLPLVGADGAAER